MEEYRIKLCIYLIILLSSTCCIELNEIWTLRELIRYRTWLLYCEVIVMIYLPETNYEVHYKSNSKILALNFIFSRKIAQYIINTPARLLWLSCHSEFGEIFPDMLQTSGTELVRLWRNDRQRVAGGDRVTAWTEILAPQFGFEFDWTSTVYVSSSTFHDAHCVVDSVIEP